MTHSHGENSCIFTISISEYWTISQHHSREWSHFLVPYAWEFHVDTSDNAPDSRMLFVTQNFPLWTPETTPRGFLGISFWTSYLVLNSLHTAILTLNECGKGDRASRGRSGTWKCTFRRSSRNRSAAAPPQSTTTTTKKEKHAERTRQGRESRRKVRAMLSTEGQGRKRQAMLLTMYG